MSLDLGGRLLLVGAGKMGGALLRAWLDQGLDPASIAIIDPSPPPESAALIASRNIRTHPLSAPPSVIVLAVKPQVMDAALPVIRHHFGQDTLALSIVAGRELSGLAKHLPEGAAVVRSMPNISAAVGRGMTAAFAGPHVSPPQRGRAEDLLTAVGEVIWVDDEGLLDGVTGVSGSGPAYVFLLAECLAEAGVEAGLAPAIAAKLARQTIIGAGELLRRSEAPVAELRQNVTSPGGTTEAALRVLMKRPGLGALIGKAVAAAVTRSRELSS